MELEAAGRSHDRDRSAADMVSRVSTLLDRLGQQVVLFEWRGLFFVSFGLYAALGTFAALSWMAVLLIGQGLAPALFLGLAAGGVLVVVFGSWLAAHVLDWRLALGDPRQHLLRPAFVSWGGILTVPLILIGFGWLTGFSIPLLLDALARGGTLGQALGRVGCLTYGCCYGKPSRGRLAVTYRHSEAKAVRMGGRRGVPLHPVPLYEGLLSLSVFATANLVAAAGAPKGAPAAAALLLYGAGRFGIEFLRDNRGRFLREPWAVNHLLSALVAAAGVFAFVLVWRTALPAPGIEFGRIIRAGPLVFACLVPCAALVFLAFSLHRGRVGAW